MFFGFFEPTVPTITAEEVFHAVSKNENIVILDVRTPEEFARKRLQNSINVPVDEVPSKIMRVITDKKQKIYVYCLSGSRSVVAVDTMIKLGYSNVFNMKSGLLAWRVNKFPEESH